jgi:hypothetical protein
MSDVPCSKHAQCINSAGSYFCSCISGYVGDGTFCEGREVQALEIGEKHNLTYSQERIYKTFRNGFV